jgi:HAD superfamily hydrolase (TIGR01509 family)
VIRCRALLLDMDGLMVDSEPLWFEVQSNFVRERGGEWTAKLANECIGGGLANALRVMRGAFGFSVDATQDTQAMIDAFVARVGDLTLKPGCQELVEAARERAVPCAVASSSTQRLVEATLERFQMRACFDAVVTGDCVVRPKPAPDIFLEAAARLAIPPSGCVVLEDSLAGVRAARAAAMTVIAVPERGLGPFLDEADAVVQDLHAARALLSM